MAVSFNSTTLTFARVQADDIALRQKETEFPGVDGIDGLPMGKSSRNITVSGISTGTPSRATLEGLIDGQRHTLTADGDSYGNCKCIGVGIPSKWTDASSGGTHFAYRCIFIQEVPD